MSKTWKWITGVLAAILCLLFITLIFFYKDINEIRQILKYAGLFEAETITENFRTMCDKYPFTTVKHSGDVYTIESGLKDLPDSYTFNGKNKKISDWIEESGTTGLLIVHDGKILFEQYYLGTDESTHLISMSVAKSVLSFLLGVSIEEGKIISLQDSVDKYVPELSGTGYEGVSIKDVLQMSSGIRFTEDYNDLKSDFVQLIAAFTTGSLDDFICSLPNETVPGTHNRYVSANTQVLGMVIAKANGKSITQLTEEKLWSQLGTESDAMWLTDDHGKELTLGGFNAVLRDYARFGLLYLNGGKNHQGRQLISKEWIDASHSPDAEHLMPGSGNILSDSPLGYGYHWWLPEKPKNDYLAIGIYGQFIYISPDTNTVIVKTSAFADYDPSTYDFENECIEVFQTIAGSL
ncbi:MAG: serine hydrolase [Spirochaetes bacterium]|nr:serine hydrolase [Spirochaetota bacterium]